MGSRNSHTSDNMDDNDSAESTNSEPDIVSVLQYLIRDK